MAEQEKKEMTWQEKVEAAKGVMEVIGDLNSYDALDVVRLVLVALLPGRNSGIKCPGTFD